MMDFGALPWSCQKGLPILLFNRGCFSVPVRLRIVSVSRHQNSHDFDSATCYWVVQNRRLALNLEFYTLTWTMDSKGACGSSESVSVNIDFDNLCQLG